MAGLFAVTFKLTRMLTIKSQAQAGTRVVENVLNERYAAFARLRETPA
jgi:hypothetical protein